MDLLPFSGHEDCGSEVTQVLALLPGDALSQGEDFENDLGTVHGQADFENLL